MSTTNAAEGAGQYASALAESQSDHPTNAKPKARFSRSNPPRTVPVRIHFPTLLKDHEPFAFTLRLALSKEVQAQREEWLGLPAAELAAKEEGQILDEVCDLIVRPPEGFDDWPTDDKRNPGLVLRDYIAGATDPDAQTFLKTVIRGVNTFYWNAVTPREFRPPVSGAGS